MSLNIEEHLLITTMSNTGKLTLLPQAGEFRDCYGILYYNVFNVKGRGINFMEKNDWQLETKSVRISTRMLWWIILAQEKIKSIELLFSCEVRHVVNLGLG